MRRGQNSWQVRIFRGEDPNGKKQYDSFTVKGTRKEADRFLREKLHELDHGAYVAPTKLTFADHAGEWLNAYVRTKLRQTTAEGYESLLRQHALPNIGTIPLPKLGPADLQRLYAKKLGKRALGRLQC